MTWNNWRLVTLGVRNIPLVGRWWRMQHSYMNKTCKKVCLLGQLIERCTVLHRSWVRVPLKFFSGFNFNCLSCVYNCDDHSCLLIFLLSSNIWSFIYSLVSSPTTVYYKFTTWQARSWFDNSVGRALYQYRRVSHGFQSRSSPILFHALISQLPKFCI